MTVEISKRIREALKAAGYGKADVSVYNKGYSMGSTVYVTIKRAAVPLTIIDEIANAHERVSRDDATGEILGGGNCFVDVRYEHGLLDEQEARINEQFKLGRRQFGSYRLEPGRDPWTLTIWHQDGDSASPGLNVEASNPGSGLARVLAAAGLLSVLHDPGPDLLQGAVANDAEEPQTDEPDVAEPARELTAPEMDAAVAATRAALVPRDGDALAPLPMLPGEREDDYSERLVRRIVRAADRWKSSCPCPPRASEPRLHALWCAVERLVAHDEGRDPFIEGDQG